LDNLVDSEKLHEAGRPALPDGFRREQAVVNFLKDMPGRETDVFGLNVSLEFDLDGAGEIGD
jgi:hypothetical protein